ncbi:putative membrane protein [Campylobacter pinnipediorum subsp. caledonicus]|uniref:hypothetical protein n=1 Tax=Campylobacter pinnipediorum TaxID=1965231 RepID=UPI000995411A|nr:hypothetical protein [Campylobacter pinnipediorum]AQW85870.1 putative membrane protein [Campylobacter pinnipediorum subsp. caledonicus]
MKTIRIILFLLFAFSFSFADDDIPDVGINPCEYGYSYDIESDRCYKDCTDEDLNKFGFPDESCIDCSSVRGFDNIANCICTGLGSSWSKSTDKSCQYNADIKSYACTYLPWGGFIDTNCANGQEIRFKEIPEEDKEDKPKKPKKDNELDFTPDKSKPNGPIKESKPNIESDTPDISTDKPNNESTSPDSPKDGKITDSNGKSDSPKDGKGTDSNGKSDSPKDGKGTDPNGKPSGNNIINNHVNGNGNEEGKDDDVNFGEKLDYTDLNSANNNFTNEVKKGIDEVSTKFDDYLKNLDKLRNLFDTNGLNQLEKSSIPDSCPKSFNVPLGFKNQVIKIDLCNFLSDVSPLIYKIFYIFFFIMFLMICIKLFIFSF